MRQSERKRFQLQYPKNQVVVKTDVSKYELTFECKPHLVSQGAQKAFLAFANDISKRWEKDAKQLGEGFFKDLMSKAIMFRWTDRMIASSGWYRSDRGYKAQIVTYTVASVVKKLRQELDSEIDLRQIWNRQSVPEVLVQVLSDAAPQVATIIKDAPEWVRNISEYAKREACWTAVQNRMTLRLPADMSSCLINQEDKKQIRKEDRAVKKIDDDIELDILLLNLLPRMNEIREAADRNGLLSPTGARAIGKLSSGRLNLTKIEKRVMRDTLVKLDEVGVEILGP